MSTWNCTAVPTENGLSGFAIAANFGYGCFFCAEDSRQAIFNHEYDLTCRPANIISFVLF